MDPHHFPFRVEHNLREEGIAVRSLFRVAGDHVALKPLGYLFAPVISRARISVLQVGFYILKRGDENQTSRNWGFAHPYLKVFEGVAGETELTQDD